MAADTELLVIGGGVVGLAIAREFALRGQDVLLIERNGRLGMETSSRNSEVVHAGLYYTPNSLRADFCVSGKKRLYEFAAEAGVAIERCGKLLVATSEAEIPKLTAIRQTALANGVDDLVPLSAAEARALEPELACVAACLSPSTGVVDSHGYMQALEGHLTSLGGMVVLNTNATQIEISPDGTFAIDTESGGEASRLTANRVVVAGGLGASVIAKTLPYPPPYAAPSTYFAKGHYFALSGRAPFRHLVYPMPSGSWLGVHFTRDTAGRGKFGPDFDWRDAIGYEFEDADGARRAAFAQAIKRFWPGLPDDALHPDYTGIRPKTSRENSTVADFTIHGPRDHGLGGLVTLFGIDSPGLTSSLAIGTYVADMMLAAHA